MTTETKETKPQSQDTPLEKGQSSEKKVTPKTYPEADYQKAVSEREAALGRLKTAIQERDTFKRQAEAVGQLEANIEELNTQISELSRDDPDKIELVKLRQQTREQLKTLKAEKETLEAEKAELEPDRQERRARLVFEIAEEFEGGNADVLRRLADKNGWNEAQIRENAADMWSSKTTDTTQTEPEAPPLKTYSGQTNGGSDNIGDLPPKEWEKALKKKLYRK